MFNASTSALNYTQTNSQIGLAVASIIIFFWFITLIGFLTLDLAQIPLVLIILGVLLRSFLHTGLFIFVSGKTHAYSQRGDGMRANPTLSGTILLLNIFLQYIYSNSTARRDKVAT